jgi:hypothetical protein
MPPPSPRVEPPETVTVASERSPPSATSKMRKSSTEALLVTVAPAPRMLMSLSMTGRPLSEVLGSGSFSV